jgi:hypothetical protein
MKHYRILSPDNFDINMEPSIYQEDEIENAIDNFVKRFTIQGYYSTSNRSRIALSDIRSHLSCIEVDPKKYQD